MAKEVNKTIPLEPLWFASVRLLASAVERPVLGFGITLLLQRGD